MPKGRKQVRKPKLAKRPTPLTRVSLQRFGEGVNHTLWQILGSHSTSDGAGGTRFTAWAPGATQISVVGEFNDWEPGVNLLSRRVGPSGIWSCVVPGVKPGARYAYHITSPSFAEGVEKVDPFSFRLELQPKPCSVVWDLTYDWKDSNWMVKRERRNSLETPISIYEVHLGSWRRKGGQHYNCRELAPLLADHVEDMGFTHVELMPVMEHPFYGSWGYQLTGYFAPTARYGTPQDLMSLVDLLHRRGIGVILDWVPSHFATDDWGLARFDGSSLFEHPDRRKGFHPDWKSLIFDYGRPEVRSFLMSSANFWLTVYHADGLRVDGVASMLYLDYSRKEGEWVPNEYGGRENLEAIDFLRSLNKTVYREHPDVQTYAEESTAWPMVSRPTYLGGLGFGLKWDLGWMHDTLEYMSKDPIHRQYHHGGITFRSVYAFSENYVLPLSHDEVVHLKGSLLGRMPGDEWQRFANLRLLLGYQWAQPGKKLLFMGGEWGQQHEWAHEGQLDWELLQLEPHQGISRWVRDLNRLYRRETALHELDCDGQTFEWIDWTDAKESVLSFLRRGRSSEEVYLIVCNFTPVTRFDFRVGVPDGRRWRILLSSDSAKYGGTGHFNQRRLEPQAVAHHARPESLRLTLPPLAILFVRGKERER